MRKLLSILVPTIAAVIIAGGLAWGAFIPLLSPNTPSGIACSEPSQSLYCFNQLVQTMNSYLGLVAAQPGPVASTATTNEQVLASTVIPAGTLSVPGQQLKLRCAGVTSNDGTAKQVKLYFGSAQISTGGGLSTTSNSGWELELIVQAAAGSPPANSTYIGRGSYGTAITVSPVSAYNITDSLAAAAGITAKCTSIQSAATAGEITEEVFSIEQVK